MPHIRHVVGGRRCAWRGLLRWGRMSVMGVLRRGARIARRDSVLARGANMARDHFPAAMEPAVLDRLAKTFDVSDRLVIGHGRRSRGEIRGDFADA